MILLRDVYTQKSGTRTVIFLIPFLAQKRIRAPAILRREYASGGSICEKIRVPLKVKRELELMIGLEPTTYALPIRESTFYN